eukprot:15366704-Ditylum_brightwellii.AAC.1
MFIPSKAWLVTSPKEYKASLCCHNLYVKDIMPITIEGLHPTALDHEVTVSDENVTIRDHLLRKTNLIESMERTNKSEETGKYFFLVKKRNTCAATEFLKREMQELYQQVAPSIF